MKNTKKVLSVVLAVVMVLSALTLVAFAHTYTGVEDSSTTSVKYEVTQVASATDIAYDSGTYTAVDNDIYAVTVYAKAATGTGLAALQVPIHYDKTLFEPIMMFDGDDLYTGNDEFYEACEGNYTGIGFYTLPARFSDDQAYKNDGTVTTSNLQKKCYGYENAYITGDASRYFSKSVEYVAPADPRFAAWSAGLTNTSKTGIAFVTLDLVSGYVKGIACLNTSYGKLINDEYLEMVTVYFKRVDGVTEQQCYGAEFGVIDNAFGKTDLSSRAAVMGSGNGGGLDLTATNYDTQINFINGAVEAAVKPLVALTAANGAKQQGLAFKLATAAVTDHTNNATPYTEASIASVDYRFVAQFSTSAFTLEYDTDGKITNTNLDEVGFVLTRTDSGVSAADIAGYSAAQVSALTKDSGDVRKCWTQNLSTGMAGGAAFAFTCRITGIGAADSSQPLVGTFSADNVSPGYIAVPYVLTNNGDIYFGQAMTVLKADILARYTNNVSTFLTKANLS